MKIKEQAELFKAETSWFHVFKDMIDNGDMAKLDGSTIKVYLVIKSYTNFATGMAFPGIELIAKKAGLSEIQVKRCLKSLEEAGYITREKAGRHNVYTLREKVSITNSDGKPQAVATWDYIPNGVKEAMAEIKNAVISGKMLDGRIIHIEHLTLNISTGDSIMVNNVNTDAPPDLEEKLIAIREAIAKKKQRYPQ
jgi:DNA-binding Lrp family transcriptional regulator